MPLAQRHAHLRVILETADAGAMSAAGVDDHVGTALGIDRHARRRQDAQQRVIDGDIELAAIHHQLVLEVQQRGETLPLVFDEIVAALAQRVPEQHGSLRDVDGVLRAGQPRLPRKLWRRHRRARLAIRGIPRALAEAVHSLPGARLQHLGDFRRGLDAPGELSGGMVHGNFFPGGNWFAVTGEDADPWTGE
jgi:hypothetical protein